MMLTRTFESSSSSAVYTAQLNPETGEASCDCPGWRFCRNGVRGCKHTRIMAAERGAVGRPAMQPTGRQFHIDGIVIPEVAPAPAATTHVIKPMLASAMTNTTLADYCNSAWLCEEKYDGERKIVRKTGDTIEAWSRPRSGKEALRAELPRLILNALRDLPDGLYDGELVMPGGRSWDVTKLENRDKLVLVLFDVVELLGQSTADRTYRERHDLLKVAVDHHRMLTDDDTIRIPDPQPVSQAAVEAIWARGGEGAILKRAVSSYQPGKRSDAWIKVKKLAHATLTIVGFKTGKLGACSITCLRHDDGRETTVSTLNTATRNAIAKDPAAWIGRRLVIQYTELTDDGSFRHGGWDHEAAEGE